MRVCRVLGDIVAAAHHPAYDGHKVMVVRPEGADGNGVGPAFIAVDRVQAGPGDRVLVMQEGNGVRQLLGKDAGPIQAVIVGIVDRVDVGHAASR